MPETLNHPQYGNGPWVIPDGAVSKETQESEAARMALSAEVRNRAAAEWASKSDKEKLGGLRKWAFDGVTGDEVKQRILQIMRGGYKIQARDSLAAIQLMASIAGIELTPERIVVQRDGDLREMTTSELMAAAQKRLDEMKKADTEENGHG